MAELGRISVPVEDGTEFVSVARYGNPRGKPVLVIHGGPGLPLGYQDLAFLDDGTRHVIAIDQRGCGLSSPTPLRANTTDRLIEDMETVRDHLGIHSWDVIGYSFGSLLASVYALEHPSAVDHVVLAAVYLGSPQEHEHSFGAGVASRTPGGHARTAAYIGSENSLEWPRLFLSRISGSKEAEQIAAAREWACFPNADKQETRDRIGGLAGHDLLKAALLQTHYIGNGYFLKPNTDLYQRLGEHPELAITVVQGAEDRVLPDGFVENRFKAERPSTRFMRVMGAGHALKDSGMRKALVGALRMPGSKQQETTLGDAIGARVTLSTDSLDL